MQLGRCKYYFGISFGFGILPLHLAMAASRFNRGRSGCCADFFPPLLPILRRKSFTAVCCAVIPSNFAWIVRICNRIALLRNRGLCQSCRYALVRGYLSGVGQSLSLGKLDCASRPVPGMDWGRSCAARRAAISRRAAPDLRPSAAKCRAICPASSCLLCVIMPYRAYRMPTRSQVKRFRE
jgi:hypothetical protein